MTYPCNRVKLCTNGRKRSLYRKETGGTNNDNLL
nr:MAG TPA: hypothetical protein [Caudoviricetes sp.]